MSVGRLGTLLLLAALWAAAAPWPGPGASRAWAAEAARPKKKPRVKVVVLVQRPDGIKVKVVSRIETRLHKALRKNKRLRLIRASRKLAEFAGKIPTDTIDEAKSKMRKGFGDLDSKSYRDAITAFSQARAAQLRALAYIKKRQLAAVQFGLALAYYHNRLFAATRRTLVALFTWRPRLKVNPKTVPRRFYRLVKRAKKHVKHKKTGVFVLRTRPSGAKAYLNGRFVGRTPLELVGVPEGTHYLAVRKHGYFKLASTVKVPRSPAKANYEFALRQNEKFVLLDQALKRSWPDFGAKRASAAMKEIKTLLVVDQAVLVKPSAPTPEGVKIEACLYDLRTGYLLKRLTGTLPTKRFKARRFAELLYTGVDYEGSIPDPGEEKVKVGPPPKPFWKRWWFWTAIGAAVVATVTGIAVPLATRDSGPEVPDGFHSVGVRF